MKRIKITKLSISIIIMAAMLFAVAIPSVIAITNTLPPYATAQERGFKNAVFNRDGINYLFDGNNGSISEIRSEGLLKYSPTISPDFSRILYRHSTLETPGHILQVGIMDLNGKNSLTININSDFSNEIVDITWLNNNEIAVTGHVNPSTQEYFVFDAKSGKELKRYAGYAFSPTPDGKNIVYAENIPHGFSEQAFHSYILNDKAIYTSDIKGAALSAISFDRNSDNFAFILTLPITEDTLRAQQKLVIGTLTSEKMKITDEVMIPDNVYGYLNFDINNNVCFVANDSKFNLTKDKNFNKENIITDSRDVAYDTAHFEKFFNSIYEYFGDESLEEIFNITWLP